MAFEVLSPAQNGPYLDQRTANLTTRWSELVGEIPEAKEFKTRSEASLVRDRGYDDEDLNIELRGPSSPQKQQVARDIKAILETYDGLKDQWASVSNGQDELEISLKPRAAELGLNQALLASQIRQAFFGEEAQRLQRGIDDIRVMVRLPQEARRSLHTLDRLKIRTPSGAEVPLEYCGRHCLCESANVDPTQRQSGNRSHRSSAHRRGNRCDWNIKRDQAAARQIVFAEAGLTYRYLGYVAEAEATKRQTIGHKRFACNSRQIVQQGIR